MTIINDAYMCSVVTFFWLFITIPKKDKSYQNGTIHESRF